jgi:hypothetical protein
MRLWRGRKKCGLPLEIISRQKKNYYGGNASQGTSGSEPRFDEGQRQFADWIAASRIKFPVLG